MEELKYFLHDHPLMLNEVKSSVDKDAECVGCNQPINKLIDSFYSCTSTTSTSTADCLSFFMHKTCVELPQQFIHPKFTKYPLSLKLPPTMKQQFWKCDVCESYLQGLCYSTITNYPMVCLKCVMSELRSLDGRNLCHPGHNNHPLTLVQRPSLFLCDACNTTATDLSYVCTECSFCIHKNCANAPATYNCKFHNKHPLKLAYSLPIEYRNFHRVCNICMKNIPAIYWVYYCANCRFFAHVKCASSTEMQSKNDNDEAGSDFPATDESSLNDMMQQFIKAKINDSDIAAPQESINHWAHGGHQIALKKRNATIPHDLADDGLLICNCCIKPISSGQGDHLFYECNSCNNFVMHTSCAQFPREMHHNVLGTMVAQQSEPYNYFVCRGCRTIHNGILFSTTIKDEGRIVWFDIGCASLPTTVKHEAHRHPLNQFICEPAVFLCAACQCTNYDRAMFGCKDCKVYIHMDCVLKPRALKHRWDPHPLYLILSAGDVDDHPHAFECELCSKEINTNGWFYHCSECDQSFHILCTNPHSVCIYDYDDESFHIRSYRNVKFGATNIYSEKHPHPHGLTFLLSKRKRICNKCDEDTFYRAVLECSQCKFIVHANCYA